MELELEQDIIRCYEPAGQVTVCQEETQEAIVPDACPDILHIADVCAQAFLSRWEVHDGQAAMFGFVQASVLYIPENGNILQSMTVKIPFTISVDMPSLTGDCTMEGGVRLRCADGRSLNPRKILLRVDLVAEVTAYRKKEHFVCRSAGMHDDEKLCQRQSQIEHEDIIGVPQRIFPMSEEIRLTGTQAPHLLSYRGDIVCSDCRVIGSKLIFKGRTDVVLMLQNVDGALERRCESFPFSQILDAKGAGESSNAHVHLELAELVCYPSEEDSFRLILDMEILAQGQVMETGESSFMTDLYSTSNQTELEWQELTLYTPAVRQILPQSLRDFLATEDVVRSICDSRFLPGIIQRTQEAERLCLTTQGQIVILYLDEEQQVRRMEKNVELSAYVVAPESSSVDVRLCNRELFASACAGGIEVRLNLEYHISTAQPIQIAMVRRVQLGEARSTDGVRPSVVLRRPESGEGLWDIAKAFGTTKQQIIRANELSSEDIPVGKMLLIPSVR